MKPITEAEFTRQVLELMRLCSWRFCHFRPARTNKGWRTPVQGDNGFPDVIAVRDTTLLIPELKVGRNKASEDQKTWMERLNRVERVISPLWYPVNWKEIEELLRFAS